MRDSSKTPKLRSSSFILLSVRHIKDLSPVRMSESRFLRTMVHVGNILLIPLEPSWICESK
jgi:hypothetical protein